MCIDRSGGIVVKRFRSCRRSEHVREWTALMLLATFAPGLAPAPVSEALERLWRSVPSIERDSPATVAPNPAAFTDQVRAMLDTGPALGNDPVVLRAYTTAAARDVDQLAVIIKNRLKRIQYRPALIEAFLAQTGLTLGPQPP